MSYVYDLLVDGEAFWSPVSLYMEQEKFGPGPLAMGRTLITHPNSLVGLGDGGAHGSMLQEGSCPTFMLTHWARDRTAGTKIPLEEVVKLQTQDPARFMGLLDRGVLQPGMRADLNVIDFERLQLVTPEVAYDLPSGAKRWLQRAEGYELTLVQGVPTYRHGQPTGELPGRLLRSPLKAVLRVSDADVDFDAVGIPQPRSTLDSYVEDRDLAGGPSAMARARRARERALENSKALPNVQAQLKQMTSAGVPTSQSRL